MEQKRFLTADEVFQLFGVDADALDQLVASEAVKRLTDLGNFKYRREDFVALVREGKLTPRTSGEMFQVDAKGEIPFLKVKNDDFGLKFDDEVSFLEIDEEALAEQANQASPPARTPKIPDNWLGESDDSIDVPKSSDTSGEIHVPSAKIKPGDEKTDFDVKNPEKSRAPDSESDVRIFDEQIDFDEPGTNPSASDSDVRLEGPVSSSGSPTRRMHRGRESDSDVRLVRPINTNLDSDSDVTVAPVSQNPLDSSQSAAKRLESESGIRLDAPVTAGGDAPESDSDVVLVGLPVESERPIVAKPLATRKSDSDVILVGSPDEHGEPVSSKPKTAKRPDSDSDVRLAESVAESAAAVPAPTMPVALAGSTSTADDTGSSVRLAEGDSAISLDSPSGDRGRVSMRSDASDERPASKSSVHDSAIFMDTWEAASAMKQESAVPEIESIGESQTEEEGLTVEIDAFDSGISLDSSDLSSGISFKGADPESRVIREQANDNDDFVDDGATVEINAYEDGISLDVPTEDSGINLESGVLGSGISRVSLTDESGILLAAETADSGILMNASEPDSGVGINFATPESRVAETNVTDESGISLESETADSGISLESMGADSGIRLDFGIPEGTVAAATDESGISLESETVDSGISLESSQPDSGIRLDFGLPEGESAENESGISLEPETADSGISLESDDADSGLSLEPVTADSGISLDFLGSDSGIGLDFSKSDSSIDLGETEEGGSGISLESAKGDSGIMLEGADSGIRIDASGDSGIAVEGGDSDYDQSTNHAMDSRDGATQTIDLSDEISHDSGLDLNLSDSDQTAELMYEEADSEETFVPTARGKKASKQPAGLSEAFTLDDSPEVEDLDISDDLDAAGSAEFSDEFAEAEEEVLEASDADFGGDEEDAALGEDDEFSDAEAVVPAAKVRAQPKEPAWGMLTVIPIICASVFMAATATILWGGIATMWTGGEAPGPAGTLISTLAGLL